MAAAALLLVLAQAAAIPTESAASAEPAAPAEAAPAAPVEAPRPDFDVPLAHAVALMTVMRLGEAVIWPDPFARTQHFAAHYEEAFTKPPIFDGQKPAFEWDGVDLMWTPLAGGALGEGRYLAWQAAAGIHAAGWRSVVRAAIDPFGEMERALGTGC